MQISCAVTAQLISAFVFATRIVHSLYYLNSKFQASSHLLWLYSPVCVRPGQKLRRPVFSRGSYSRAPHKCKFKGKHNCHHDLSFVAGKAAFGVPTSYKKTQHSQLQFLAQVILLFYSRKQRDLNTAMAISRQRSM